MNPAAAEKGPESELVRSTRNRPGFNLRVWAIALAAGVAAGLGAWLLGELVHDFFRPQVFPVRVALTTYIQPTLASLNAADLKNAALVFTVLGGATGLVMGAGGGLAVRSPLRGLTVGLGGLVAGGAAGALGSLGLFPFFSRQAVPNPNDLLWPILIHAGVWMAIGTVGGAAFAVGMRCGRRVFNSAIGACLGALLATLVFHGLSEGFFLDSPSTVMVATSTWVRLLAVILVTVLSACGSAYALQSVELAKGPRRNNFANCGAGVPPAGTGNAGATPAPQC